ncbi:MAG TPA: Fe2+-dependent dioxygenase [Xanthobacteraceae bacterium]|nr:Fe2+-dependent dioxygenase [Xanthobacteraceae bacterium]
MMLCIADVFDRNETAAIRKRVEALKFVDGRSTAGWVARLVKDNEQADPHDRELAELHRQIEERILVNELFHLAVRPKALTPLMISRYKPGKQYGTHVDDALMRGMRTDVSFTLFLAEPETYEGGALVIETVTGEQAFKLAAGSMIVYPSNTLHRVAPVDSGERLAAVGWARSFVRSPERREILFDLETARRELFDTQGKSSTFDQLSKCSANLLRMWADD